MRDAGCGVGRRGRVVTGSALARRARRARGARGEMRRGELEGIVKGGGDTQKPPKSGRGELESEVEWGWD
jgi:hypothetical protein